MNYQFIKEGELEEFSRISEELIMAQYLKGSVMTQVKDFDKYGVLEFMFGKEEPVNEAETTGDDWQDFQNTRNKKKPPIGS